jgi:6-pyruvoyltetrahydropterin/6-carboxytetrahydropterin synthase
LERDRHGLVGDARPDRRAPHRQRDGRPPRREAVLAAAREDVVDAFGMVEPRPASHTAAVVQTVRRCYKRRANMWEISTETSVAAAHQLRLAPGEGERLHGHNWRIKVTVRAERLDERGFVMDFNELLPALRAAVEPYEHVFLNEVAPFDDVNPTAENIARVVFENLAAKIDDGRVRVVRLEVWENDVCAATYF